MASSHYAPSVEDEAFFARVRASKHLCIVLQSEAPSHYTFLEVKKNEDGSSIESIEFKDSLRDAPATPPRMVEKILQGIGLVDASWRCLPRTNKCTQEGQWECGLWATRYLE